MHDLLTLLDETPCSWIVTEATWSPYALVLSLQVQVFAQTTTLQHWQIVCREPQQHVLLFGQGSELYIRTEHPLLWQHDRSWRTTFSGATAQPELIVADLQHVHQTLSEGWMPPETFLNTQVSLETLLAGPVGLLATGPARLMDAYAAVLRDHGFNAASQQNMEADHAAQQVLVYKIGTNDDCFVIASEFEAVCLHAPASTFALRGSASTVAAHERRAAGRIEVWRIGSPHYGDLPTPFVAEALHADASALGLVLDVRGYRSSAFAALFFCAWEAGMLPDIIATNNYLNIDMLHRDSDAAQLLETVHDSLGELDDFVFQVRTSPNYHSARQLALRGPTMPATKLQAAFKGADAVHLETLSAQAVRAYAAEDVAEIQRLADAERIGYNRMGATRSGAATIATHVVAVAHFPQLCFVRSILIFEGQHERGWQHVVTIWRHGNDTWRLLLVSNDPITTKEFFAEIAALAPQMQERGQYPTPAMLCYPADGGTLIRPGSGDGDFEHFVWQPSTSPDLLAEIVEIDFGDSGNRLFLFPYHGPMPTEQQLSAGKLWGNGSDRWRVWSIGMDGGVAFSETRSFVH